jgi:hypothetical protein
MPYQAVGTHIIIEKIPPEKKGSLLLSIKNEDWMEAKVCSWGTLVDLFLEQGTIVLIRSIVGHILPDGRTIINEKDIFAVKK